MSWRADGTGTLVICFLTNGAQLSISGEVPMSTDHDRRNLLAFVGIGITASVLTNVASFGAEAKHEEVGAVEDLMREHGIIRRSILVYRFSAARLRGGQSLDPKLLQRTAKLLRNFGEDYHERKLEEEYLFTAVKKAGGRAAGYIDNLLQQHRRGRDVTEYVLSVVQKGKIGSGAAEPLSRALDGFELMYEHHASREDTIVFPAWKKTMNQKQLAEMGEKFEDIEHQQFGKDGFDDAEMQISAIETELGIGYIAQFTPAMPPK
jgi:hemerythrin-like domain-containing protein